MLADKGYDADGIRADLAERNIEAAIPGRSNRRVKIEHDRALYKQRNRIERMFGQLKINRAIATRYDQLANSFLGMVHIATARYWLKLVVSVGWQLAIRTLEGFAYLAVVIDLYSRRVVGWSMQSRQTTDVVLQALHMAVWRRKPKQRVLIHSDQGSQFTSMDWAAFIRAHNLEHSMSRRGNCHDNAVAESFFSSLKRERIRRRTYKTREEARQDVFDYIEMFYNPVRKQVRNGMLSPAQFERQQFLKAEGV